MKYNAVLFDLDGTLLDTLADLGNSVNRILKQRGFPVHDLEAYRYFVGDGSINLVRRALPEGKRDDETVQEVLKVFKEDYREHWADDTRPYPGINDLLARLTEHTIPAAVFTNKYEDFARIAVNRFFPEVHFETVLGMIDTRPLKPDPAGALEAARTVGLPPESFVYLGDSGVDMQTAMSAGMLPVGALWGFREADELKKSGAEMLIDHPMALLEVFLAS